MIMSYRGRGEVVVIFHTALVCRIAARISRLYECFSMSVRT